MVYFDLKVSIVSDNISEIFLGPSFEWCFRIRCSNCHTDHPNEIYFSESLQFEVKNSKGTANFVMKCKECSKDCSINVYEKSPKRIDCSEGKGQGILATFDCRGCELINWVIPSEDVFARSLESDTIFENVDLNDVWMDYDEKSKGNCSLEGLTHQITRNKTL